MKQIIANAPLSVLLCTATAYKEDTNKQLTQKKLFSLHPVQLKKITEDILHKTYTEKGAITGIWSVLSTAKVRKSCNKLADDRNEVASYMSS